MTGSTWTPGMRVLDTYEVRDVLVGGMGVVYRVHHREWDVELAVKEPRAHMLVTRRGLSDFVAEARTWMRLGLHPHTVRCVYVRDIEGLPRVFAEWVDGASLKEAVRDRTLYAGGPAPALARILDTAVQFAWGLHHAHTHGLVHRDVKPANVMVARDGTVKVTDFGLATATDDALEHVVDGRSRRGFSGTRAYCSPEQAAAEFGPAPRPTRTTDVWSWALCVLEMFTGYRATKRGPAGAAALEAVVRGGVPVDARIPALPGPLADLLRRCLVHDPGARPGDMAAIADELISAHEGLVGTAYARERPEAARLLADDLSNQALSQLDLGRPDDAATLWQQALSADPHHLPTVHNRGLYRWRSGLGTDSDLVAELREVRGGHPRPWLVDDLLGLVDRERGGGDRRPVELSGPVDAYLAIGPDGRWAAADHRGPGDGPGAVRVWDVADGRCRHVLRAGSGRVHALAVGRRLVAAAADHEVLVWEAVSGRLRHRLTGPASRVRSVAWAPDDEVLAAATEDGTVHAWDTRDGRCLLARRGPPLGFGGEVALRRDGCGLRLVKWEDSTQRIRTWDFASGSLVDSLQLRRAHVRLAPGGRVAVVMGEGEVHLRDLVSREVVCTLRDRRWESCALEGDGRWALTSAADGVQVWDLTTGRCLRTLPLTGHTAALAVGGGVGLTGGAGGLRVSPLDGAGPPCPWNYARPVGSTEHSRAAALAVRARDQAHHLLADGRPGAAAEALRPALAEPGYERSRELLDQWAQIGAAGRRTALRAAWQSLTLDVEVHPQGGGLIGGTRRQYSLGPDSRIALSPDGRAALTVAGTDLLVWDLVTGARRHHLSTHGPELRCATFGGAGRFAVAGGVDTAVRVWDVATGELRHVLHGHPAEVDAVVARGGLIVSGCRDGTVRVWDVGDGRCLRLLSGAIEWITSLAVGADARVVVAGGFGGTGAVWRDGRDDLLRVAAGVVKDARTTALSSDGRTLLSPTLGGGGIWRSDPVTGELLSSTSELAGHSPAPIRALTIGADGRRAHSTGDDGAVRVWNLSDGTCAHVLTGHDGAVTALASIGDGHLALSGGDDGTVRLWDAEAGRCLRVLEGRSGRIHLLALSADARTLLTVGADGTVRVWRLEWEYAFDHDTFDHDTKA